MQVQFTRSPSQSQKAAYFRIREACFRHDLRIDGFDGSEDAWDRRSELLIALDGTRCIGGVRITGCPAALHTDRPAIPLEAQGITVAQLLPDLILRGQPYCQPTRLAITPDYRHPSVLNAFATAIVAESASLGYSHCIAVAGMARSRLYRRIFHSCGYGYRIYGDVAVPAEPGFTDLPHVLSVGFLESARDSAVDNDWRQQAA